LDYRQRAAVLGAATREVHYFMVAAADSAASRRSTLSATLVMVVMERRKEIAIRAYDGLAGRLGRCDLFMRRRRNSE